MGNWTCAETSENFFFPTKYFCAGVSADEKFVTVASLQKVSAEEKFVMVASFRRSSWLKLHKNYLKLFETFSSATPRESLKSSSSQILFGDNFTRKFSAGEHNREYLSTSQYFSTSPTSISQTLFNFSDEK